MSIYANSYTTWKSRWQFYHCSYPVPTNYQFWHHFCPIRIPLFIWHWREKIIEFHIRNASNNILHSVNQKRPDIFQTRRLVSQKVIKQRGYSDCSCRELIYSNVSFWFHFYCFVDSVVYFTSSETNLLWSHRLLAGYLQWKVRLIHCKVLLYYIWKVLRLLCFGATLIASFFSSQIRLLPTGRLPTS